MLQVLVQSDFEFGMNRAFLLEHHNAIIQGLNAIDLAVLFNPALAVAELTPIGLKENPGGLHRSGLRP